MKKEMRLNNFLVRYLALTMKKCSLKRKMAEVVATKEKWSS